MLRHSKNVFWWLPTFSRKVRHLPHIDFNIFLYSPNNYKKCPGESIRKKQRSPWSLGARKTSQIHPLASFVQKYPFFTMFSLLKISQVLHFSRISRIALQGQKFREGDYRWYQPTTAQSTFWGKTRNHWNLKTYWLGTTINLLVMKYAVLYLWQPETLELLPHASQP